MLAQTGPARSRKRQASAAASANQSVTLPVWIAEITGGHSKHEAVAAPVAHVEDERNRERDDDEDGHDDQPGSLERSTVSGVASSAGSGGYGIRPAPRCQRFRVRLGRAHASRIAFAAP